MNKTEKKILNLKKIIEKYNHEYYVNNNSLISDDEYDYLINKLNILERENFEFINNDSPTKKIPNGNNNELLTNKHYITVKSLKNIFTFDEIENFFNKISDLFKENDYIIEYKIDGLTIVLEYLNCKLIKALTRGNGYYGENVLTNILKINDIPKKINFNKKLIIRGEIYITKENFEFINNHRLKNGLDLFSNPRNTASGAIRNFNMPDYFKLSSMFFSIQNIDDFCFQNDEESLIFLKILNFPTIDFNKTTRINSNSCIVKMFEEKNKLNYNVDGIVIKLNNFEKRTILGETSKFPRWAVAFKNKTNIVETKIINIINSVGRFGIITPVAILEPVLLDGSIIKKATLHNYSYIKRNDIRINDIVKICKSGEIIPKILSVNLELRKINSKKILIPNNCPVCNELLNNKDEKNIFCENQNCFKQLELSLCHYISKDAMNINFLGEETIKCLIKKKIVFNIYDLYNLNLNKLCLIDGIKKTKAEKILSSIENSKQCYLKNFIYALGINNVGIQTANKLSLYFRNLNAFLKTDINELNLIKDLGKKISKNIILFIEEKSEYIKIISNYLHFKNKIINNNSCLFNKKIVITGKFKQFNRNSLSNLLINNYGSFILKSISNKIDILIVGNDPGSKIKKANLLGIKIIYEEEIIKILKDLKK